MPFDALTIAAIRQELERTLLGGRVQNVIMPGPLTISLEIYRAGSGRNQLLMSAHPQNARVQLTPTPSSRDPEQHPPLLLLLRKFVRGGTLYALSQPARERVLTASIAKRIDPDKHQEYHFEGDFRDRGGSEEAEPEDSDAPVTTVELVIEVMGRLSNIVLVAADGTIMDSIKRIPPSINRVRTTLPHQPYIAPPPQAKRDPLGATINVLSVALSEAAQGDAGAAVWKGLVSGFAGVSPTLAREVVWRAFGDAKLPVQSVARDPAALARLLEQMRAIFTLEESGSWEPTVAWREEAGGVRRALDFAPYRLTHLAKEGCKLEVHDSISQAASEYFAAAGQLGGHSALRAHVHAELEEIRRRDERKLSSLRDELQRSQALEEIRRRGEAILSYMHTLKPGEHRLAVPDEKLIIELDPGLSPVENAQALFREYRKAQSAQASLPEKVAEAEMRVEYLDELATSLDLASSYDEIRAVQGEVRLAKRPTGRSATEEQEGKQRGSKGKVRKTQEKRPQPLRLQTQQGAQMLVGRTASQNDVATFRLAAPEDLWFHARGVPGSHVILRIGEGITPKDIEEAATVAAAHSRARNEAQVDVLYTEKKYVRKVPNSPPGFVTYKHEQVIRVAP
ncbi:MAG: NFACT family protein [Chloroflexi bacterium]|nr:NFACT family protein [Chloroflexota bacterium]